MPDGAGSPAALLAEARAALCERPDLAEQRAEAVLRTQPGHREARLVLGVAHRRQGRLIESLALLKPLVRTAPDYAEAHAEWGATQAAMDLPRPAIASLRQAVTLAPQDPAAWALLGELLLRTGETALADSAFLHQVRYAHHDPVLRDVSEKVDAGAFAAAEQSLRARLAEAPRDVAALRMLADLRLHAGDHAEAEALAVRCLALAPSLTPARMTQAAALLYQGYSTAARPLVDQLLAQHPDDPRVLVLQASLLAMTGSRAEAAATYRRVLRAHPDDPNTWLRLGHVQRTAGQAGEAAEAYRRAAALEPALGDAWWSLANLKTDVFTPDDLATMRAQVARPDIGTIDRSALHYALGSALERAGDYAASFAHYAAGAKLQRTLVEYNADDMSAYVARVSTRLDGAFFAARPGGDPDPAPIFVVGLPRAGSTLVEQILASHSSVEGTAELRAMGIIADELGWQTAHLPDTLAGLGTADRARLGAAYLARTRQHRLTDRPFFVDKMPDNFLHAGLIHLILPRARIVDVRRQPMAACFAAFKQLFARGTVYSYDLRELGRYYRDYVALMAHWDAVLPGRVHHVAYEDLVTDTECEVRRLLEACGLPFEPACLRFHETRRDVATASSEQVRRPIFRDALEQWRCYEPWLGDLRAALDGA